MKKETTYRVRALGRKDLLAGGRDVAADGSYGEELTPALRAALEQMTARDAGALLSLDYVRDFELARLETIVSGPVVLAERSREGVTYRRTIIDTREYVLRPWADPGCMARWLRLSEEEDHA